MVSSASADSVTAADLTRRIGVTNEQALAYVRQPDPALNRMSRRQLEELIAEIPAVTAGALLGPAALARHFVASASAGRYRDLFGLWELFSSEPEACRPVLVERPQALERARTALRTATTLGLYGHADRVARDVTEARGLIWQWMQEILAEHLDQVAQRPIVASALLERDPSIQLALPDEPDETWLREAAEARADRPLAPAIEQRLRQHVHRLPATIATLELVREQMPNALDGMLAGVDLARPDIDAVLAWARDHGVAEPLRARIQAEVADAATRAPTTGLEVWWSWRERGVPITLPSALLDAPLDDFDLARPDTAALLAAHAARGNDPDAAGRLEKLAVSNRQLAEKAYEALVCAGLEVTLPAGLERNPVVRDGTRCPACQAWTWVRPGHEARCPRLATPAAAPATG
jgi:hypothetical protein